MRTAHLAAPIALSLTLTSVVSAQADRARSFLENCQRNRSDNEQFCETRNATLAAGRTLSVDGQQNGGITVHAWDQNKVQVLAMIQAQGETVDAARAIAGQIQISANPGDIHATGPSMNRGDHSSWSVSYEVWVPRATDLTLTASNGGISVDGMSSKMTLETVNGGISLNDIDGDVHGVTTNGGVTASLSGDAWHGAGLDLRTTNGGVNLTIPASYSAQLESGTTNGRVNVDFPVTVQGSLSRRLSTQLGRGGAPIHVETMNGGVTIRQR